MKRAGWTRLSPPRAKLTAQWQHTSGWMVRHCGHQTALWPYFAVDPAHPDATVVTHNGFGFRRLEDAFGAIEEVIRGASVVTEANCVPGVRRVLQGVTAVAGCNTSG